ncbi:hypothetical protein LMG28727_07507 [Paraburkholderia kirstenboschensis]|uniref:hypothetical protein n=1 Tax=Paraburkholderia kirstenboschensis TaxID=1245436 RepID=UPI000AE26A05|nr:hypothetical protein [Paraburkholderia kirstenboschensis]CAD6561669.1 hypothetical protein LMG28727_07507 [Paraburkholderia kirstenboschensis]
MTSKETGQANQTRPVTQIAADFKELLATRLSFSEASGRFELLWDEANAAASRLLGKGLGHGYIALLRRMHAEFSSRYPDGDDVDSMATRSATASAAMLGASEVLTMYERSATSSQIDICR